MRHRALSCGKVLVEDAPRGSGGNVFICVPYWGGVRVFAAEAQVVRWFSLNCYLGGVFVFGVCFSPACQFWWARKVAFATTHPTGPASTWEKPSALLFLCHGSAWSRICQASWALQLRFEACL